MSVVWGCVNVLALRANYNNFAVQIYNEWDQSCFKRLGLVEGTVYTLNILSILKCLLMTSMIKSSSQKQLPIRCILFLFLEIVLTIGFIILFAYSIFTTPFRRCGTDAIDQKKARGVVDNYIFNLILDAVILWVWRMFRKKLLSDERITLYFDNFVKSRQ